MRGICLEMFNYLNCWDIYSTIPVMFGFKKEGDTITVQAFSPNGEVGIVLTQMPPSAEKGRVNIKYHWPIVEGETDLGLDSLGKFRDLPRDFTYFQLISPNSNNMRDRRALDLGLMESLGYVYNENTTCSDGTVAKTVDFEYPTAARLNRLLEGAFPDGDFARFVEVEQSPYRRLDFMQRLLLEREFMISQYAPWGYHDHAALHVLGQIGMGRDFIDYLREKLDPHLGRVDAEKKLPKVPGLEDSKVYDFYHPSIHVLKRAATSLDNLSGVTSGIVFGEERTTGIRLGTREGRLANHFSGIFTTSNIMGQSSLMSGIEKPTYLEAEHFAGVAFDRYQRLQLYLEGQK